MDTFEHEPIEYIRSAYDFDETLFRPKNQVQDLLCFLTKEPEYLQKFMESAVKFFVEYEAKSAQSQPVDWRIKESLMYAIATIQDYRAAPRDGNELIENGIQNKAIDPETEEMLQMYILPELDGP